MIVGCLAEETNNFDSEMGSFLPFSLSFFSTYYLLKKKVHSFYSLFYRVTYPSTLINPFLLVLFLVNLNTTISGTVQFVAFSTSITLYALW